MAGLVVGDSGGGQHVDNTEELGDNSQVTVVSSVRDVDGYRIFLLSKSSLNLEYC